MKTVHASTERKCCCLQMCDVGEALEVVLTSLRFITASRSSSAEGPTTLNEALNRTNVSNIITYDTTVAHVHRCTLHTHRRRSWSCRCHGKLIAPTLQLTATCLTQQQRNSAATATRRQRLSRRQPSFQQFVRTSNTLALQHCCAGGGGVPSGYPPTNVYSICVDV